MRAAAVALLAFLSSCTVVGAPAPPAPVPEVDVPRRQPVVPATPRPRPVRSFDEVQGLWVVRSTMTSEREVLDMVRSAYDAGFNTLIVQIRGRGDAFYRSSLEPRGETVEGTDDFDPLALTIREAHARGMAVHAWVNTHLIWGPTAFPESPDHIVNAHPEWLAVPRSLARELYDVDPQDARFVEALRAYARENSRTVEGMYTSPSHPAVKERVHAVWMDLAARYDLDGIHFDYIRFPSRNFDYSRGALERFRAWLTGRMAAEEDEGAGAGPSSDSGADDVALATGADALALVDAFPEAWDDFRRAQVTGLVERIYRDVKALRPELTVSAAVVADADVAYGDRFQDWRAWLADGIVDVVVPMAYTPDDERFASQIRTARAAAGAPERVWAGVGAYLNTLGGTLAKIDLARELDAGGVIIFSYDWVSVQTRDHEPETFLETIGRERFGGR